MKEDDVLVTLFMLSFASVVLFLIIISQGTKLKESEIRLRECKEQRLIDKPNYKFH